MQKPAAMSVCGYGPLMGIDPAQCSLGMSGDVVVPVFCRGGIAASLSSGQPNALAPAALANGLGRWLGVGEITTVDACP